MKHIGIICPSLLKNNGGLEHQVRKLFSYLEFVYQDSYKFYYICEGNKKQTTDNVITYEPDAFESTKFTMMSLVLDGAVLLSSWNVDFWLKMFNDLNYLPLMYSERSCPELVEKRWNKEDHYALLRRADKLHFFYDEYLPAAEFKHKSFFLENKPYKFRNNGSHLLYVGKINRFPKRTHLILDVVKNHPVISLYLCGNGDQELIDEYSGYPNIHFLGYLNDYDLYREYLIADFLVSTSEYEGCPNNVIDARELGIPVIGFKSCAGVRLASRYEEFLINDIDSFEQKVLQFVREKIMSIHSDHLSIWIKELDELCSIKRV